MLLYTRIAPVHTEFFPDLEGIVRAKAELLPWLDDEGTLVINADDPNQNGYPAETGAAGPSLRWRSLPRRGSRMWKTAVCSEAASGSCLPDGEAEVELGLAGTAPGRESARRGGRRIGLWRAGRAGG